MWKLISERNSDVVYCLLVGKEYNIGRRDCEILISDDMSISRKHAVIKVIHPETNLAFPGRKSVLNFKDLSKLGTQLPDVRIANGQERDLKDGDRLIFGTAGISRFRVGYFPIVLTTSCLAPTSKKDVKRNALRLGGHLVSEWCPECEYVVMTNLSVTVKVISALLSLKPVVTPQYLDDLVKAAETSTKLPDAGDYLPALSESQINSADVSFGADARRQNLFQGKTFVFLSPSQHKKLHMSLELGGALTKLITNEKEIEALASRKDCCVMAPDVSGSQIASSWLQNVQSVLNRTKRRMIAESEIGFAVLYCSTKVHCNGSAEFNVPHSVLPMPSLSQNVAQLSSQIPQSCNPSQSTVDRNAVPLKPDSIHSLRMPITPVKIKEEVLSQPVAETPIARNKKRDRDETQGHNPGVSAVFDVPQDAKKCRLEADNSSNLIPVNSASANAPDLIITETTRNKNCDRNIPAKTNKESSTSSRMKSDLDAVDKVKESLRAVELESLEMDFSIGTCIEPSGVFIKQEAVEMPISRDFERGNKRAVGELNALPVKTPCVKAEKDLKPPLSVASFEPSKENIKIQPGYLSTLSIKMNVDPEFEHSIELPSNVVVTEVRNLVFRKPGQNKKKVLASQGLVIWNGKSVKNFKKFKKSLVSHKLPHIIGGRALMAHESIPTVERDDWFRNEQQAESQRAYSELLSQELASWQPKSR